MSVSALNLLIMAFATEHPVLAPGDRAHKARAQSLARGMYIDDGLWKDLQALDAESRKENV